MVSTKGAIARDENGRLIESGRLLTLKVEAKDLDKAKTVIDAQWLALRMAAVSGAAEVADELDKQPPPALLVEPLSGMSPISRQMWEERH
ncbi:hypothetical protein IMZ48_01465, partial [Candidatus Bathyarchaeota archaeon]|nr:hypothetical protein [Candidatus Bathyarchaeota archaeon]